MDGETTPGRAIVHSAGWAYRLKAEIIKEEFGRNRAVLHLLLRYTQALITQITQTTVCTRHHSIDQQPCRRLLLSLDRLEINEVTMTQELIANRLGARREGVTEAAGKLRSAGLIRYNRGRITVINRAGLETRCCECYDVVRQEYDRLLGTCVKAPHKVACSTSSAVRHAHVAAHAQAGEHRPASEQSLTPAGSAHGSVSKRLFGCSGLRSRSCGTERLACVTYDILTPSRPDRAMHNG